MKPAQRFFLFLTKGRNGSQCNAKIINTCFTTSHETKQWLPTPQNHIITNTKWLRIHRGLVDFLYIQHIIQIILHFYILSIIHVLIILLYNCYTSSSSIYFGCAQIHPASISTFLDQTCTPVRCICRFPFYGTKCAFLWRA